jgi:hypothetical protein
VESGPVDILTTGKRLANPRETRRLKPPRCLLMRTVVTETPVQRGKQSAIRVTNRHADDMTGVHHFTVVHGGHSPVLAWRIRSRPSSCVRKLTTGVQLKGAPRSRWVSDVPQHEHAGAPHGWAHAFQAILGSDRGNPRRPVKPWAIAVRSLSEVRPTQSTGRSEVQPSSSPRSAAVATTQSRL